MIAATENSAVQVNGDIFNVAINVFEDNGGMRTGVEWQIMVGDRELRIESRESRRPTIRFFSFIFSILVLFCVGLLFVPGCSKPKSKVDSAVKLPGEVEKAKLLKHVESDFEDSEAHYQLGKLYHRESEYVKAEYEYNLSLSFDPAHRDAQAGIVKVLLDSGDESRSKLTAEMYINQVSGSAVELTRLGLGFQHEGLDEYALQCYRKALDMEPNSAKINRQIGYYYLSKGDDAMAREYLKRSFQIDHNQPDVAGQLGRLGVEIKIPRNKGRDAGKLDKMVEKSDKELAQ